VLSPQWDPVYSATDYVEAACHLRRSFQRGEKTHSSNTASKGLFSLEAETFRIHRIHMETGKMLAFRQHLYSLYLNDLLKHS